MKATSNQQKTTSSDTTLLVEQLKENVPKIVQTVHPEPPNYDEIAQPIEEAEEPKQSRQPYIELALDENTNEWTWVLWSANGRPMAVGVMPFKRRNDCMKNINAALELFRLPNLKITATI